MKNPSKWVRGGFLFTVALALLMVSPAQLSFWQFQKENLTRIDNNSLFQSTNRLNNLASGDLDRDGNQECVQLLQDSAEITDCADEILWKSDPSWQVMEIAVGDLNHDGDSEVTLLVWRPFRPWPIDRFVPFGGRIDSFHNRQGKSCQIILIGWWKDHFDELWAGSALVRPVSHIHVVDMDNDGNEELVSLEGAYDKNETGGSLSIWRWQGFGFVLVTKTKEEFQNIYVYSDLSGNWILAQS